MKTNFDNETADVRITRCLCPDCTRRKEIEYINYLIARADKRLKEENTGITDSWSE